MNDYFKKLFSKSGDASMVPIVALVLIILILGFAVIYAMRILDPNAGVNLPVINTHISFMQMLIGALLISAGITGFYEYKSGIKAPPDSNVNVPGDNSNKPDS